MRAKLSQCASTSSYPLRSFSFLRFPRVPFARMQRDPSSWWITTGDPKVRDNANVVILVVILVEAVCYQCAAIFLFHEDICVREG